MKSFHTCKVTSRIKLGTKIESAVYKCPAAGQGFKQTRDFHWNILPNFLMVFDVSLEKKRDANN